MMSVLFVMSHNTIPTPRPSLFIQWREREPINVEVDFIDRGEAPWCGNGPVFIGHASTHESGKPRDGKFYSDEACRRVSSYGNYGTELTDFWTSADKRYALWWDVHDGFPTARYAYYVPKTKKGFTYAVVVNTSNWSVATYGNAYSNIESLGEIQRADPYGTYNRGWLSAFVPKDTVVLNKWGSAEKAASSLMSIFATRELTGRFQDGRDNVGFTEAYYNAMENLPQLATNSIANIVQIVDTLRTIREVATGHLPSRIGKLGDLAKDAWLGYRYVYSTTKLDIQETSVYACKLYDALQKGIPECRVSGTYSENTATYRFSCKIRWKDLIPKDIHALMNNRGMLERVGLALNLENVWDLIPYSFVVDWFLPVGDWLASICNKSAAENLEILDGWYSKSGHMDMEDGTFVRYYMRFSAHGHNPNVPSFRRDSVSGITWVKRAIDGFALFA